MGKLQVKREEILTILGNLAQAIDAFEKIEKYESHVDFIPKEELYQAFQDSMIKRFNLAVQFFWEYVKLYIQDYMGQVIHVNEPKSVIKDAVRLKIISDDDLAIFFAMFEDQKMATNTNNTEIVDQICSKIKAYYDLMKKYTDTFQID